MLTAIDIYSISIPKGDSTRRIFHTFHIFYGEFAGKFTGDVAEKFAGEVAGDVAADVAVIFAATLQATVFHMRVLNAGGIGA